MYFSECYNSITLIHDTHCLWSCDLQWNRYSRKWSNFISYLRLFFFFNLTSKNDLLPKNYEVMVQFDKCYNKGNISEDAFLYIVDPWAHQCVNLLTHYWEICILTGSEIPLQAASSSQDRRGIKVQRNRFKEQMLYNIKMESHIFADVPSWPVEQKHNRENFQENEINGHFVKSNENLKLVLSLLQERCYIYLFIYYIDSMTQFSKN